MVTYWEAPVPLGRRNWVDIHFCHSEAVKLQQQFHIFKILFLIYPRQLVLFNYFSGRERERECQYPGDSNRRIRRKNENDNPVRRWHFFYMHFCPGTMTTHVESINSDLQRGLDRRLRHTQH